MTKRQVSISAEKPPQANDNAARIELEKKITNRAEVLAAEIVTSCDDESVDYDYLIERFFEILEFFSTDEIDHLAKRDLADTIKEHIFKFSKDYFKSYDEYRANFTSEVAI